jgi:hypothetical protein
LEKALGARELDRSGLSLEEGFLRGQDVYAKGHD